MNINVHLFLRTYVSYVLGIELGVELLGHIITLCVNSLRNCHTVSVVAPPFMFPPALHEGSNFSISLPALVIIHLLDKSYLSGYKVVSLCVFGLHFPNDSWCWASACAYWQFVQSLEKCLLKSFACFYTELSFCYRVVGVLYVFGIQVPDQMWFANVFSHSGCCLFTFLMVPFQA